MEATVWIKINTSAWVEVLWSARCYVRGQLLRQSDRRLLSDTTVRNQVSSILSSLRSYRRASDVFTAVTLFIVLSSYLGWTTADDAFGLNPLSASTTLDTTFIYTFVIVQFSRILFCSYSFFCHFYENQHLSTAEQFLEDFVFFAFPERPFQFTTLLLI